ncbi:hypothetical protein HDU77_006583 [Chytriomyces hyalinus]|nr:hypothetical protein HDU77_006583 [Chytriomyces hyalinus]
MQPLTTTTTTTKTTSVKTAADGRKTTTTTTKTVVQKTVGEALSNAETIKALYDQFADLLLEEDALSCVVFGVKRHEDKLFDISIAGAHTACEKRRAILTQITAFEAESAASFGAQESADVVFLRGAIEGQLAQMGVPGEDGYFVEMGQTHMTSVFVHMEMMFKEYQPTETKQDLVNYRTRLELMGPQFDAMIEGFQSGINRKITLNKDGVDLLVKKFSDSCGGGAELSFQEATDLAIKSPLNRAEECKTLIGDEHFLVPVIRDTIISGFAKARKFLLEEYMPHARTQAGIYGLPGYEEEYSNLIYYHTNVRYSANEIHEIGVKEVARIEALMEKAKTACGYEGSLADFKLDIQDREKFPALFYDNLDNVIPEYEKICAAARIKMEDYFNKFPKFDCKVEALPEFMEQQMPLAMYMAGTPAKSGSFMVNMHLHKTKPKHTMTALSLHEAIPGHHHQVSLALENEDLHLGRRMVHNTAFAEGWALYCEYLGEEMGFYSDPFQYFGRLDEEMFRAVRLVVDSGLHAKGWSVEQAISYFLSKVGAGLDEVTSEVKRYCVMPGQALAYKVGEMKIRELRRYAEEELKEAFDVKEFHNSVLDFGSLPLSTLDAVVKKWVADVKASL